MNLEWPLWESLCESPWELYFHGFVWVPLIQRLILLSKPGIAALYRHGRHLGWGWHRLLELPRGRAIAANLMMGLLVPVGVGMTIRLLVGPFGEDWDGTPLWVTGILLGTLLIHTAWDVRRTWKVRQLIFKILETEVERYRSYYDRVRGWAKRVGDHADRYHATKEQGGPPTLKERLAGGLAERAGPLLDRVMVSSHSQVRRWSIRYILEGVAFHLLPVMALAILLLIVPRFLS